MNGNDVLKKLGGRKFVLAVAAFLGSLGAGITGIVIGNTSLATAGTICSVISAALYAACEAYVDAASVASSTSTTTNVTTNTTVTKGTEDAEKNN